MRSPNQKVTVACPERSRPVTGMWPQGHDEKTDTWEHKEEYLYLYCAAPNLSCGFQPE